MGKDLATPFKTPGELGVTGVFPMNPHAKGLAISLMLMSVLAGDIVPGVVPDQTVDPECTPQATVGEPGDLVYHHEGPHCTPLVFVGQNAEGGVINADLLDGIDSTGFLLTGGKATDSDKLDGFDATAFLGVNGKATDADKLDGLNSNAFLGVSGKAADSDKLDNLDSTAFLLSSGKATDADKLDNLDSTAFLLATGKAADAHLLDGMDSTAFLAAGAKAADSDKLDGLDSAAFLGVGAKAADADKLDGLDSVIFLIPAGAVMAFDLAACPSGWTDFGAAAGRTIVGVGVGLGLTPRTLGDTGGSESHTLTTAQMAVHSHSERIPIPGTSSLVVASASDAGGGARYSIHPSGNAQDGGDLTTGNAGEGQAHPIMDPFIALRYCKKL